MEGAGEGEHVLRGQDDEAIVDHGKTSCTSNTNFEKEELESHRAVYVGVHVPLGKEIRHKHRHRGHKHHRKRKELQEEHEESLTQDTPSQRVQFILGTEDDDEEHVPHELFTELDELSFREGREYEWKETARWLKFEEDVEDGGERWSKPYVATLSLHSLFELRSCILNGTVLLDMRANTIEDIADMIMDSMVASKQLVESLREQVRAAILKRHHHQNEKKLSNRIPLVRSLADMGRKHSDPHLLEKNGEGLSSSRLSLLKPGSSTSSLFQRRESRVSVLLNHLLPSTSPFPSPFTTPQNTPPSARRSPPLVPPPSLKPAPQLLVTCAQGGGIPEVVVFPPEEDDNDDDDDDDDDDESPPPARPEEEDAGPACSSLPLPPEGLVVSPQCAAGNLDNGKPGDSKMNRGGGQSGEQHCGLQQVPALTFPVLLQVDMNFMRKIPAGAEASNVLVGEVDFLERPIIAFVRLSPAVLLTGLTEVPVPTRFLFLMLGPNGKGPQYHEIGRSMATLMTDEIFHDVAYKAKDRTDLLSGIDEFLDQVTVLPPGEWDPTIRIEPPKNVPSQMNRKRPPLSNGSAAPSDAMKEEEHQAGPELQRTGRIFGGLIMDVKRKVPCYWSDIRDALSLQCLASILFLYCACMSPVITFGGLLGEATKGNISAIESLFGASLTGVAFSLFAGQPLTILGSTGPVLVFEKILFKFCTDYNLSYLSLRTSIGLWTAFLCLLLVATDASSLVCYITRFTEEAFAALICIIFIYEALEKIFHLGELFPINMHNNLDNLTLYMCQCAPPANASTHTLQYWNQTGITPESVSWSQLNVSMCQHFHGEFTGSACGHHGPSSRTSSSGPSYSSSRLSSSPPSSSSSRTESYFPTKVRSTISDFAVFLTILIMVLVDYLVGIPSPKLSVPDRFEQITAVIINRKEHKLKKGCGYHLDLLVVSLMLGVCSIMGLPWFVAATVLSISHVNSLKLESACSAPGEQPKFLGIREQRVTGLMIFVLMGMSVFMTSVLKFIPMPVLYGVFLYMGVSSLKGIQFFDRIKLFGMPAKHQPDLIYLRYVPLWKVHVFTLIQLSCLVLLWVIKASAAAVVFPMMVLALVFIRKLLDFGFTKRELSWLDDIIPESKKKKEDDKKKKEKEAQRMLEEDKEEVTIPYDGGNPMKIDRLKDSPDPPLINITDEVTEATACTDVSMDSDSATGLRHIASQEKMACVRIAMEEEQRENSLDVETSL
ncbi:hypothetical protein SKAU_G00402010 [Synaphobranchus kaupii]|uniref:Anion exchange protein n=1 Tax=Synaphobranchus kaupii TaxID=118154 RepID=A0A9Q1ICH0_SYNKA|nr:hypothetical protein SKAU_G00402010 [Synaphobranchus kaupii]